MPHNTRWGARTHLHRVHSMTHVKSAICQGYSYVSEHQKKTSACRGKVQGLQGGQGVQGTQWCSAARPEDSGVSGRVRDTGDAGDTGSNLTPLHPQNTPNPTFLHSQSQRPQLPSHAPQSPQCPAPSAPLAYPVPFCPHIQHSLSLSIPNADPCSPTPTSTFQCFPVNPSAS